jgi:LacI family sucrose operon transcriptional repressor
MNSGQTLTGVRTADERGQPPKRITIKDVAAETSLTATAVSRALRGMPDISKDTTLRVVRAAERMGYINNSAARGLREGRTKLIAIVYDNLLNPYFSIMTEYLQKALCVHGYSLIIFSSLTHYFDTAVLKEVISRNVDGIITFLEPERDVDGFAETHGIPIVLLGRKTDFRNIDCIDTDDRKGGAIAAEHLSACGCKRILAVMESGITCAKERYEGFREELERRESFHGELSIFLDGAPLKEKLDTFLNTGAEFDGVFCFNDMLALETVSLLAAIDKKSIMVMGYDNIQEDIRFPCRLTTVGTDKRRMAADAAETVIDKIVSGKTNRRFNRVHDVYLVKGETT